MLDSIERIFFEGPRPGGGGDRVNTFFVPFAPWDWRSTTFQENMVGTLAYIYLTYDTLSTFGARISADGHILVQQTTPFVLRRRLLPWPEWWWILFRLLVNKGHEQLVLSVKNAKKIATVSRFPTKPRSGNSLRSRVNTRTTNQATSRTRQVECGNIFDVHRSSTW